MRFRAITAIFALGFCFFHAISVAPQDTKVEDAGWPTYGGDPGGQRYSPAKQITRANVSSLQPVWTYHTGALQSSNRSVSKSDFEATPILFRGALYLSTPFDRVVALDPESGKERWTFDPRVPDDIQVSNYTSRGVAAWQEENPAGVETCSARIFVATLDARLLALDTNSGKPCEGFGSAGTVDLKSGIATGREPYRFFGNTSPPTVVGDVVVVGSAVVDNFAVEVESGAVRGFDARTGHLLWSWNPIPWADRQRPRTSAANAWSVISADPAHGLVFVPTGSASPDFYGGLRPGDDRDANSVVALNARTGKKIWAFQLIHHDVWDYDVAAQPLLFDMPDGTPAVAVSAKPGIVFVLNRLTGQPLIPVDERPVPQNGIAGEQLSRTQPFSSMPAFNALTFDSHAFTGHSKQSADYCAAEFARLRYDGIFTPPTLGGTLQFPGSLGGVNWGSMSYDPDSGILYANSNGSAYEIRLVPQPKALRLVEYQWIWWTFAGICVLVAVVLRKRSAAPYLLILIASGSIFASIHFAPPPDFTYERRHNLVNSPDSVGELSANTGAPYRIFRRVLQDEQGRPCTPTPWGSTTALDLLHRKLLWTKPLGTLVAGEKTGTVNFGAPIVTAGGLLFTAASAEPLLRAIDKTTGEEVWTGRLPVPAQSTPMAYTLNGREYIVVSAGGHGGLGTALGDSVVAFALPQ